jgi:drug/metabolite transporter (DMT)-like permease
MPDHSPTTRQLLADAALLLVTLIWGATFVMVKDAVSAFPVFSFMALRFTLAAAALVPLVLWRRRQLARAAPSGPFSATRLNPRRLARLLLPSFLVGSALFAGYAFQTAGLAAHDPAKAGFITGLSVVIVPMAAALLLRQSPERNAWRAWAWRRSGLALLSLTADLQHTAG